jgi:predicted transposase/invertase (TIGR01784 family)
MKFISPKTDFAFKKIFGSEQSHGILISFLNGLVYKGEPIIQDLTIINPYQAPKIRGVKDTYLDVKATLSSREVVIIEMQVLNVAGFEKRILYNAAKSYSTQLDAGQDYTLLNPVIALTITDFEMFPDWDAVISSFVLKEKDFLMDYPSHDLELVFVELPKFHRQLDELITLTDKWIYFLQNARQLEQIPPVMGTIPEIEQAFQRAQKANLSREELEDLEMREIFIHDQRNAIVRATQQGLERGIEQGLQQGIEQGRQQGVEEGARQAQIAIAQRLLQTLDEETVHQITGLPLAEVKTLKKPSV